MPIGDARSTYTENTLMRLAKAGHKEHLLTDDEYNAAVSRLNDMVLNNLTEEEE